MKAGRIAQTILHLAGFKNVKSKVINWQIKSYYWRRACYFRVSSNFSCLDRLLALETLTIRLRLSSKHLMRLVTCFAGWLSVFQINLLWYLMWLFCCISDWNTKRCPREVWPDCRSEVLVVKGSSFRCFWISFLESFLSLILPAFPPLIHLFMD